MSGNLSIWERFADIDPKFTKPISGRDYSGTSPNPQYVIRCLTELFGPVGKGFGWNVAAEDFKEMGGTYLHWCRIRFWWKDEDGVHSVEEYGQTKAAYVTSKGTMRVDEDAPKKSLTDAIIKGASHIGIAANIFLGRWDDQKYVSEVNKEFREEERQQKDAAPKKQTEAMPPPEYNLLLEDLRKNKTQADIRRWIIDADVKDLRRLLSPAFDEKLRNEAAVYGKTLPTGEGVTDEEARRHTLNAA